LSICVSLSGVLPSLSNDWLLLSNALGIHENNLTSPLPISYQNITAAQDDIPTAADIPRTLLLDRPFGASEIELELTTVLDSERRLEQDVSNATELFLINEWNPRISFQFDKGSKVGLINIQQVLIGKIKPYDSYQDVIANSTLWKNIPLSEDVVLRLKDKDIHFIIAEVQFVNGTSGLYSGRLNIEPFHDKATRERVLQQQLNENADLKVIPSSVPNISNKSNNFIYSHSVHGMICRTLEQYGFLVCTANDLPPEYTLDSKSISIPGSNKTLGLTSNKSSNTVNVSSTTSASLKPSNNTVESTKLLLDDAIGDIQNGDNEKAILYLNLVNEQLMITNADNTTALPNSITVLVNDAIERLQNGDSNEALLYLNLVNKQLPSESSDKQTGFVPDIKSSNLTTTDSNENQTRKKMAEAPGKDIVPLNLTSGSGEQDTFIIKSGKITYPIKYAINNGTVNNVTLSRDQASMIINLSTTDIGMLGIELPRDIMDSKGSYNNTDEDYFVFADGLLTGSEETSNNNQSRTLLIDFENGVEEIEVLGTEILGVKPATKPLVIPQEVYDRNETNYQTAANALVTYSNYDCGIEIQYPSDWNEVEASEDERSDSGDIVTFYVPQEISNSSSTPQDFAYLSIIMNDLISTKTLRGITIKNIDALEEIEPKFNLTESKPTLIGNLPAHQIIYTSGSDLEDQQNEIYKSLVMWTIDNAKSYLFRFSSSNTSTFDQYLPAVYSIINSTQITTPGEELTDDYTVSC
jgi:hypothetical protein